ncbi:MAG: hypothetical protein GDA50_00300 [Alphaproteobacteria bacterium GM202ARS2]|nr:hypothetical protein [Alphaproteobacteria bacterium GM202ARS2]
MSGVQPKNTNQKKMRHMPAPRQARRKKPALIGESRAIETKDDWVKEKKRLLRAIAR